MAVEEKKTVEHVLCIPECVFRDLGRFQGFSPLVDKYLPSLLDESLAVYVPRDQAEGDKSYKQLIPYCIFKCGNRVFSYSRGSSGGESRLHAMRSIGVGGHISTEDAGENYCAYFVGMNRELNEEVEFGKTYSVSCVGLINDDATDVGRVHLGVVHLFELHDEHVVPREDSMADAGFSDVSSLIRDIDCFETWSQFCLKSLFA